MAATKDHTSVGETASDNADACDAGHAGAARPQPSQTTTPHQRTTTTKQCQRSQRAQTCKSARGRHSRRAVSDKVLRFFPVAGRVASAKKKIWPGKKPHALSSKSNRSRKYETGTLLYFAKQTSTVLSNIFLSCSFSCQRRRSLHRDRAAADCHLRRVLRRRRVLCEGRLFRDGRVLPRVRTLPCTFSSTDDTVRPSFWMV